jgi:aminopeptidase N
VGDYIKSPGLLIANQGFLIGIHYKECDEDLALVARFLVLNNCFAAYFTLLFIEQQYGCDAFLKGLAESKQRVDAFYAKNSGYRIIHQNLSDMDIVTNVQTCPKGRLHMLCGILGDDILWKGIRIYSARYMNGSATTVDFIRVMEETSGKDLKTFFDQWLYKPGTLKLKGSWTYNAARKEVGIQLDQVQTDGSVFTMPLQIDITLTGKATPVRKTVTLSGKTNSFVIPVDAAPTGVVLDPEQWVLMEGEMVVRK